MTIVEFFLRKKGKRERERERGRGKKPD